MKILITLAYSDIFNGEIPKIEELLKDIPSTVVISILAFINAQLYHDDSIQTQLNVMSRLMEHQPMEVKRLLNEKVKRKLELEPQIQFFSALSTTKFIHNELISFRDIKSDATTL